MRIFLKDIASKLLDSYGSGLADHCIVFPNNRSILFFRKYIAELIDRPLFMPSLQTINSLIAGQSELRQAETVQLVYELYNTYLKAGGSRETFDDFYFWGEMLINDFDDIDKYLVDPRMLFSNLADLKEIDRKFGSLSEDVLRIIRQFWINFEASKMTVEKSDFLSVWEILPEVYSGFTSSLRARGLAYEGMILREQAGLVSSGDGQWCAETQMFHFVGFNALNKCEKVILEQLKKEGRAQFYWDYDPVWVDDAGHEAGHFIRQNLSAYPAEHDIAQGKTTDCSVRVYSAPSDVAQAKLLPSLLEGYETGGDPNNTAIILADENLLTPVLNSLPESTGSVNVTMGYPLFQTPVYSLVHQLLRLQKNKRQLAGKTAFYYNDVINILQHQYIAFHYPADTRELLKTIKQKNLIRVDRDFFPARGLFEYIFGSDFNNRTYLGKILEYIIDLLDNSEDIPEEDRSSRLSLQQEYIYSLLLPLNQLGMIIEESGMDPGIDLYSRLIDRIMRKQIIPFSGEPLEGLQVMGILETRALDFKNIIFLSANEACLPVSPSGNSYIPYNLREAFALPTIKHSDSIYAYYFYRLLQRAENVSFVYNSSTDGTRSGEMSRFLLQLKYDHSYDTFFNDTGFRILPPARVKDSIERTAAINDAFESAFLSGDNKRPLSPSAINTWISCNMKFYYKYIAGIKEAEELLEEVDALTFGNILHDVMKQVYEPFTGNAVDRGQLDDIAGNKDMIARLVKDAFRSLFMQGGTGEIRGKDLVVTSIIEKMAGQIIMADKSHAPFVIVSLEEDYPGKVSFDLNGSEREAGVGGTIDRVDLSGGVHRVLDYKSGGDSVDIAWLDSLFDYDYSSRNSAAFQTLLYCELFLQNNEGLDPRPALYPVRKIFSDDFSDFFRIKKGDHKGTVRSYIPVRDSFVMGLRQVLSDIFDQDRDIIMTGDMQKCRYCPYNILCNRKS
ncbi:MAG: PD-(D/E)XK nuclease family protein [Bacteroidota bacterium]